MIDVKRRGKAIAFSTVAVGVVVLALTAHLCWPQLRFWYRFASVGLNAQGYPEYRHRKTGIVFVKLPGGTFWMGAQKTDPRGINYDPDARDDEGPVHEATLCPFLIAKYEVTQAEWQSVMESNPSHFKGDASRPVERLSWSDIQPFLTKTGLELPAEAQWEYACRAGTTTPYAGTLEDLAWYSQNSGRTTHPVGEKEPNAFGLYDLHGNLYEWCAETTFDESRPVRGGTWDLNPCHCRSAYRARYDSGTRNDDIGFRVVWPAR